MGRNSLGPSVCPNLTRARGEEKTEVIDPWKPKAENLEQVLPEQPCDAFNLFFQEHQWEEEKVEGRCHTNGCSGSFSRARATGRERPARSAPTNRHFFERNVTNARPRPGGVVLSREACVGHFLSLSSPRAHSTVGRISLFSFIESRPSRREKLSIKD